MDPQTSSLTGVISISARNSMLEFAKKFAEAQELSTFRDLLRYREKMYQLQLDHTAEAAKRMQNVLTGVEKRSIMDIASPVVLPQVESATAYQAGVFLSSYPVFGMVSNPATMDEALQFETVMGQHASKYGWPRELIKVFRNGFKHNFGPAFVHWKNHLQGSVVTSTDPRTVGLAQVATTTVGGNSITALDPFNCVFDLSINPSKYHEEGTAFIWNTLQDRTTLKRMIAAMDPNKTSQLREAYESSWAGHTGDNSNLSYHVPQVNLAYSTDALTHGSTNWLAYLGLEKASNGGNNRINYKDRYIVSHVVFRGCPSDFGHRTAAPNIPRIYHGVVVNWKVMVFVEEIISPDDQLPVVIMTPNEDGMGHQTQSLLDTALPYQDLSSSLWNIALQSKRRLVFDRLLYNPKFINKEDIDRIEAVGRVPVRNASLLKDSDISRAVFQIPFRDDGVQGTLQMSELVSQMADTAVGQNKVDRGQFQKGNKTKTEFDTTMQNSNSRQQLQSIVIEHQFMNPIKAQIKNNMLLYQQPGPLYNPDEKKAVEVDPVKLRQSILTFQVTDGLLNTEKLLNSPALTVFMQMAQAMPTVNVEYDVVGMFLYFMKLQGATWLQDFKRSPEQQQQFQQTLTQASAAQNALPPEQISAGAPQ